ncbi:nucleotidyltransferase domain-containing protein [Metallosphaera sedula]|uniref:nucleotidyltransferase domain-containing protein n=1 Tax=Metallosphaera sedula TaxID=43687 RepID=UPI0020BF0BA1|nr:nucleotidyltransferase domain-containing protein [Metallosphaera sedula]BBL46492.1 DNA polymerase subunit beta [Metallosphaera sedula]
MSDYLRLAKKRQEALSRLNDFLKQIKEFVISRDPQGRVLLFGSVARGNSRPDSDIDVLIISDVLGKDLRTKAKTMGDIMEILNNEFFEIHVVTREEYENWYKKFIDVWVEI